MMTKTICFLELGVVEAVVVLVVAGIKVILAHRVWVGAGSWGELVV